MKIIELLNAASVFAQFNQMKISPRLAYKIMKFVKGVEVEEEFYNNKRMEIINTYVERDEMGQPIADAAGNVKVQRDKIQEANAALTELADTEVEVPNIRFTLSELDGLQLSVAEMYALDAFIDE